MKTKQIILTSLFGLSFLCMNAQDVQSNILATSGGLRAAITTSGAGENTFYGYTAGGGSGSLNTAENNGSYNTFIGSWTGTDHIGNRNAFLGGYAGQDGGGNENVYLGAGSGNDMHGDRNTYIGTDSGGGGTGSRNVMIGYNVGNDSQNKNDKLYIANTNTVNPLIWGDFAQNQLKFNAKVGVGYGFGNYPTTSGSVNVSNYNLFVKGGILTEEVRVSLANTWADYVFKKDYKLATLKEVETYIQQNGHLQNVPSAKEVASNGLELGQIVKIQQEKIEELTLYLIDLNKKLEEQSKKIETLTNQNK